MGKSVPKFKRCWRKVGNLTIVFPSRDAIYVTDGINKICVNRWYCRRADKVSREWRNLVKTCKRRKSLSVLAISQIAYRKNINIVAAYKMPEITEEFVELKEGNK